MLANGKFRNYTMRALVFILILMELIIHPAFLKPFKCYSCISHDWDIQLTCERVDEELTNTVMCNEKCYAYDEEYGVLNRACYSEEEYNTHPEAAFYVTDCTEDYCNNEYLPLPREVCDYYPEKGRKMGCNRCSSTMNKRNEECLGMLPRNMFCNYNRLCAIYYRRETNDLQRNCHCFQTIQQFINESHEEDTYIFWCATPYCNNLLLEEFECSAGEINTYHDGCLVVKGRSGPESGDGKNSAGSRNTAGVVAKYIAKFKQILTGSMVSFLKKISSSL